MEFSTIDISYTTRSHLVDFRIWSVWWRNGFRRKASLKNKIRNPSRATKPTVSDFSYC